LKVLIISIVPSPYQRDLFKALSEKIEVSVFYLEPESPDSPWPKKPLESYESILPGTYLSYREMRFLINWRMPDITGSDLVILNGYMGMVFQWLLRFKSKSNKFIFWGERMSDQTRGIKGKIQEWLSRSINNCIAIAAIGTWAQKKYQVRFPGIPVFNIPYFCNLESFQNLPLRGSHQTLNLLFCGQMIHRKGVDVLLKAFELLSPQYDVVLHLVGREAELNEMKLLLNDVSRKVIYHGFQAPEDLPYFFNKADVFILPSRHDGWGVVVNQALGAGLPIICSDQVGAAVDLINEGKNGYLFTSGDAVDLHSKIKIFVDRPELIPAMSSQSREKSYEMTPEKGAEKWLQVFNRLI
jgi:poly(glycerol-phosphate) alpha-glucosyltransferase